MNIAWTTIDKDGCLIVWSDTGDSIKRFRETFPNTVAGLNEARKLCELHGFKLAIREND